jgi:prepilin-type N-terminal cleavage/methylation domain-containing protein
MNFQVFRNSSGMSLLELVISMAILSVVLMSMIYGMSINMKLQYNSRVTDMAIADMLTVRDNMLSAPFTDVKNLFPDDSSVPGINNVPGETITVTYPAVAGVSAELYMCRVHVTWLDYQRRMHTKQLDFWKKK